MKILVVDDHDYNRDLLAFILEDEGHLCLPASNGEEAIKICREQEDIDLILMDVMMPGMDGIEATKAIKKEHTDRLITIIFVSVLDDAEVLARCLDAGGDDFIPKPVNESILHARINAHKRTRDLYENLRDANRKLQYHKQIMEGEQLIVEKIFARGTERIKTQCVNVKKYSSPASMLNGDVVLESPSPSGGLYLLVGDFTGHGLAASIGTLPVSEIFYRLAETQASIRQIAREINRSLAELLPDTMFFCAALSFLDASGRSVSFWLGGINDIIVLDNNNSIRRLVSQHMPLGVLSEEEFDETLTLAELSEGERVFIYTDGVNEVTNSEDEQFGLIGVEQAIMANVEDRFQHLIDSVRDFRGDNLQNDDISLVEITAGPLKHRLRSTGEVVDIQSLYYWAESFQWCFQSTLRNNEFRNLNFVDQLMTFFGAIRGIELHREKIYIIISELYNNALEHGVLELDSNLKSTADGFQQYYELREKKLNCLEESTGEIVVGISFHQGDTNQIEFVVSDSGKGFDHEHVCASLDADRVSYGRGIALLKRICSSLQYSKGGSRVVAIYDLRKHEDI